MSRLTSLFAKFGLFGQKQNGPDAFDMRLVRIGTREGRVQPRATVLFRNQPSHSAA